MADRHLVRITVNGSLHDLLAEPRRMLCDVLRTDLRQTGTHVTCEMGICGACTVLVEGDPVRSCLVPVVAVDDQLVQTVESLAQDGELSDLQEAFVQHHALQCGFCTPGFLMLATWLLQTEPDPTDERIVDVMSSNLCRCTGYAGIVQAVKSVRDARLAASANGRAAAADHDGERGAAS